MAANDWFPHQPLDPSNPTPRKAPEGAPQRRMLGIFYRGLLLADRAVKPSPSFLSETGLRYDEESSASQQCLRREIIDRLFRIPQQVFATEGKNPEGKLPLGAQGTPRGGYLHVPNLT